MTENLDKGLELHKLGKLKEAKKIYNKLLKKDTNNFKIINLLGVIYLQLKNYSEAIVLINSHF